VEALVQSVVFRQHRWQTVHWPLFLVLLLRCRNKRTVQLALPWQQI
jgi:hypothetical protein